MSKSGCAVKPTALKLDTMTDEYKHRLTRNDFKVRHATPQHNLVFTPSYVLQKHFFKEANRYINSSPHTARPAFGI